MDNITRHSLLIDFYGSLLTDKQKEIYDLYYQQDLSLGEIAEQKNVSRQAVFDLLKRTEETLDSYEHKLGLVGKYARNHEIIGIIRNKLQLSAQECPALDLSEIMELLQILEDNW